MKGLPTGSHSDSAAPPWVSSLAVNRGRLFAGLSGHMLPDRQGVHVFDARTETWSSVGLNGLAVYALLSYEPFLYAGAGSAYDDVYGIYRARIPIRPHGKAVTTWARVKQGAYEGLTHQ